MVDVILRYKKKENPMEKYEVGDLVKLKHKPRVFKDKYRIGIVKEKRWNRYAKMYMYVVLWNSGVLYRYRNNQLTGIQHENT
tara:strand:- start:1609 stop:1854 length:246 start_codon:yes stop_codon:yes gene_type:complete